jgi:methanethiol S-methyltransferase
MHKGFVMLTSVAVVFLFLIAFAVLHSLTAALPTKRLFLRWFGARAYHGLYRLLFNALSGITYLPLWWLMGIYSGPTVWSATGIAAALLTAVQIASLVGLVIAGSQIDMLRFTGVRQVWAYLNDESLPLPPEPFIERGMYGLVRHPLYLFIILYLWASPHMNTASAAFALGATIYFAVGAWHEEIRLAREIGPQYRDYQQRVPFLLPGIASLRRWCCDSSRPDAPANA